MSTAGKSVQILYDLIVVVLAYIAEVNLSGAGPPFSQLYLILRKRKACEIRCATLRIAKHKNKLKKRTQNLRLDHQGCDSPSR